MKYLIGLLLLPLDVFAGIKQPVIDESLKGVPIDKYHFDGAISILASGLDWMSNQSFILLTLLVVILIISIYNTVQIKKLQK